MVVSSSLLFIGSLDHWVATVGRLVADAATERPERKGQLLLLAQSVCNILSGTIIVLDIVDSSFAFGQPGGELNDSIGQ